MEMMATINTRSKRSRLPGTPDTTVNSAKTTEAAPRRPAQDTRPICPRRPRRGGMIAHTATGLPIKSIKSTRPSAGRMACGRRAGVTKRPIKKKIAISAISVSTSKTCTISRLEGMSEAPSTMPARYTERNPLPPSWLGTANESSAMAISTMVSF